MQPISFPYPSVQNKDKLYSILFIFPLGKQYSAIVVLPVPRTPGETETKSIYVPARAHIRDVKYRTYLLEPYLTRTLHRHLNDPVRAGHATDDGDQLTSLVFQLGRPYVP